MTNMKNTNLCYFLCGASLGLVVAVLWAPKSGGETREYLRSKADESTEYIKDRAVDLRNAASETIERGKETLRRNKENLGAAIDAGKEAYRESVATTPSNEV
jgi:gas vesicle protein